MNARHERDLRHLAAPERSAARYFADQAFRPRLLCWPAGPRSARHAPSGASRALPRLAPDTLLGVPCTPGAMLQDGVQKTARLFHCGAQLRLSQADIRRQTLIGQAPAIRWLG